MTDEPNFTPETHSTYEPTPQEVADREIEQLVAQVRAGIGNRQEWFQDEAHRSLDRLATIAKTAEDAIEAASRNGLGGWWQQRALHERDARHAAEERAKDLEQAWEKGMEWENEAKVDELRAAEEWALDLEKRPSMSDIEWTATQRALAAEERVRELQEELELERGDS